MLSHSQKLWYFKPFEFIDLINILQWLFVKVKLYQIPLPDIKEERFLLNDKLFL